MVDGKSPSMFVSEYQPRYIVVTADKVLRYFKQETDYKEAGSCYLTEVELLQQQNNEKDCRIFVIKMKEKDRLFVFEAADHTTMMTWVKALKSVLENKWSKGMRTDVIDSFLTFLSIALRSDSSFTGLSILLSKNFSEIL